MFLAERLLLPAGTSALLLDLDGVIVDSLSLDYELVSRLLRDRGLLATEDVPRDLIRENFPYDMPEFWRRILAALNIAITSEEYNRLVAEHEKVRATERMPLLDGVIEILEEARRAALPVALVSNNPKHDLEKIISSAKLQDYFDAIVGNDRQGMKKKPAPDPYLEAARQLATPPARCVAVEDSVVGAQSAATAGCFVVGVATGACDFSSLADSSHVTSTYVSLDRCFVSIGRGGILQKSIVTPNEFVSHMLEHIAWRLGCSIDVVWTNDDWKMLGDTVGRAVAPLLADDGSAGALGMIDDGSCELVLRGGGNGGVRFRSSAQVDLDWFLGLRCEQLRDGRPLVELLDGIGAGGNIDMDVLVASVEDPHHSWEGVFRGIGIALEKLSKDRDGKNSQFARRTDSDRESAAPTKPTVTAVERGWRFTVCTTTRACVVRETAESVVSVDVQFGVPGVDCHLAVGDSVDVAGAVDVLREFAIGADLHLSVDFTATHLSSSHVVMEDIGLTLGRALREIAIARMTEFGIYGAGSNIGSVELLDRLPVRVGVSMEGRKFWKYVPLGQSYTDFRRAFLIGHTLPNGLYTEDLDDFVDGFSGGLAASVIVHIERDVDPVIGWPLTFRGLGEAIAELLQENPDRKALTPGVKATLA